MWPVATGHPVPGGVTAANLPAIKNKQILPELLINRFLILPSASKAHLFPPLQADHRN